MVFADGQDAKNPGDVNPMLPTIAMYVNTLETWRPLRNIATS